MKSYKGLFLARLDLDESSHLGIKKKVFGQLKALQELVGEVELISYSQKGVKYANGDYLFKFKKENAFAKRINYFFKVYTEIPKHIDFSKLDFLFIRYQMTNRYFDKMLSKIKRVNPNIKIIIEFPTFPFYEELVSWGDKLNLILELESRNRLKKSVDFVTTYFGQNEIYGIPAIHIENAIDTSEIKPINTTFNPKLLNVFGVANLSKWHGFDRVIKGLSTYENNKGIKVVFHIVGEGEELANLKELTSSLGLNESVIFYGRKSGNDLANAYNNMHIGIASLGMFRIGHDTGSTLKAREYCAKGLPFIIGYKDSCFDEKFEGALQVSNDETPIDIAEVVNFYLDTYQKNVSDEMIAFAKENLGWKTQLKKVLDISFGEREIN